MDKVKVFFKNLWDYIYYTKIGKLMASLVLAATSFGIANILDPMFYVGLAFLIYPIGLFIVMMAYAWVINPIRDWKESQDRKNKVKSSTSSAVSTDITAVAKKIIEAKSGSVSQNTEVVEPALKQKKAQVNKDKTKKKK